MSGTMYLRCKRTNQTVFLYVEPSDTPKDVKKKLSAITKVNSENIRLLTTEQKPLQEDKTLLDLKIENDHVVYWVQKKEGSDAWEEVNIQKIEPAKSDDKAEDKA